MLKDLYDEYIASVSPSNMALSWESLTAIEQILDQEKPRRILDYGSGFGTCLFAIYAKANGAIVESYDSDSQWLARSQQFLESHDLAEHVTFVDNDTIDSVVPAEFVSWDYDKNPIRVDWMPLAFNNVSDGGILYVDDMHSAEIEAACRALNGTILSETPRDSFGRYGAFVRRHSSH